MDGAAQALQGCIHGRPQKEVLEPERFPKELFL